MTTPQSPAAAGVPPPDPLADAWQRIDWANDAGQAFRDRAVAFFATDPYKLWAEWNGDQWQVVFHSRTNPTAEHEALTELAGLLGSFLDHARAALNYTAYQVALLAVRENPSLLQPTPEGGKPFRPESAEFPIFKSQDLYNAQHRMKKLAACYVGSIEAVQPYHGGHDALRILHELAAEFRHHIIHPTVVWPVHERHMVFVGGKALFPSDLESEPHGYLQPGDVLLRFKLTGVGPGVEVAPKVALAAGVDHPLCEGREAIGLLKEIIREVTAVMNDIETKLFK